MAKRAKKTTTAEASADLETFKGKTVDPRDSFPEGGAVVRGKVDLSDFNHGKGFVHTASGEEYGLKLVDNHPHGHTHHLKNAEHYWSGTADQFKAQFEKK